MDLGVTTNKSALAWHWVSDSRCLTVYRPGGQGKPIFPGKTYRVTSRKPLALCQHGLHYSYSALDALHYARGPVVCRVRVSGDRIDATEGVGAISPSKGCARWRKVVWMADATATLCNYADSIARTAMRDAEQQGIPVLATSVALLDAHRDAVAKLIPEQDARTAYEHHVAQFNRIKYSILDTVTKANSLEINQIPIAMMLAPCLAAARTVSLDASWRFRAENAVDGRYLGWDDWRSTYRETKNRELVEQLNLLAPTDYKENP